MVATAGIHNGPPDQQIELAHSKKRRATHQRVCAAKIIAIRTLLVAAGARGSSQERQWVITIAGRGVRQQ